MKKLHVSKIMAFGTVCAALAVTCVVLKANNNPLPANAADLRANAGNTFVLTPTPDPSVFEITANAVAQVSLMGNCTEHAELEVRFPTSPGQPILLNGAGSLTSSDGATTLKFTVTGTAKPDAANPAFYNNSYQLTFTGGSGDFATATGAGEVEELVLFSSPLGGTGTWTMKGYVVSGPQNAQ
jgi:hypothetical protein